MLIELTGSHKFAKPIYIYNKLYIYIHIHIYINIITYEAIYMYTHYWDPSM